MATFSAGRRRSAALLLLVLLLAGCAPNHAPASGRHVFVVVMENHTPEQALTRAAYKVLGEILWDATASDGDFFSWLVIHYPERILVNDRSSHSAGITERFFPSAASYDLYRHN